MKVLREIMAKCDNLPIKEIRYLSFQYVELVFFKDDMQKWASILTEFLGPPAKEADVLPAIDDLQLTKKFGSIVKNQTLYMKKGENHVVIAMIWPWGAKKYATLKIIGNKEGQKLNKF